MRCYRNPGGVSCTSATRGGSGNVSSASASSVRSSDTTSSRPTAARWRSSRSRAADSALAQAGARHLGDRSRSARQRGSAGGCEPPRARRHAGRRRSTSLGSLLPELGTALSQAGDLPGPSVCCRRPSRAHRAWRAPRGPRARLPPVRPHAARHGTGRPEILRRFSDLQATFAAGGDELGLDRLWRLRALVHWVEAAPATPTVPGRWPSSTRARGRRPRTRGCAVLAGVVGLGGTDPAGEASRAARRSGWICAAIPARRRRSSSRWRGCGRCAASTGPRAACWSRATRYWTSSGSRLDCGAVLRCLRRPAGR